MPLQDYMKLVSVDDHVVEHPRVWQDRLPERFREAGPRVVDVEMTTESEWGTPVSGLHEVWTYEGRRYPQIAIGAAVGLDVEEFGTHPIRFEQLRPGCYDPIARLKDMDADGVDVNTCFPSFPRFSGTLFLEAEDKELALLCVQAYNDFILDEWCAAAPDRYIPMVILPLWDPSLAATELERTVAKGAKTISFPENPAPLGLPSFHTDSWDPVFAVANEANIPLSIHFGTSGVMPKTSDDAPFIIPIALMQTNLMYAAADIVFSQVFHKFPNLRVVLSEGGIGWIPYFLERLDFAWEKHRHYNDVNKEIPPSQVFREHIWGCFVEDDFGVEVRDHIGIDRLMWELDYPHADSLWPNARKLAAASFADVPDEEVHKIVELNARQFFDFPASS